MPKEGLDLNVIVWLIVAKQIRQRRFALLCKSDVQHLYAMSTELSPPRESSPTFNSSSGSSSPLANTQAPVNSNLHGTLSGSSPTKESRPLADIISERFSPFDHAAHVVGPFEGETARDLAFEQGKV